MCSTYIHVSMYLSIVICWLSVLLVSAVYSLPRTPGFRHMYLFVDCMRFECVWSFLSLPQLSCLKTTPVTFTAPTRSVALSPMSVNRPVAWTQHVTLSPFQNVAHLSLIVTYSKPKYCLHVPNAPVFVFYMGFNISNNVILFNSFAVYNVQTLIKLAW